MPDGFAYHIPELHHLGGELADLGPGVAAGLDEQALTGHAGAWGGDDPGTAFGEAFADLGSLGSELLGAVTEGFAHTGQNVQTMATTMRNADEAAAASTRQIEV